MRKANEEVEKSKALAYDLEERMQRGEVEKREADEARVRAEDARRAAEDAVLMEKEERERREEAAAIAQEEAEEKDRIALQRQEEARKIQGELEEARIKMEQQQRELQEALAQPPPPAPMVYEHNDDEYVAPAYEENERQESMYSAPDEYDDNEGGESSADLHIDENQADLPRPEEDRITQAQKNKKMQQQLNALKDELSDSKDQTRVTKNDVLHKDNQAHGRDKYKTLKQIRQGNTKHRVDMFEAM
jgi:hypothetical protein